MVGVGDAGGVRVAAALSAVLFLAACSSGPRIVTNVAPGFDLVGYQTFSYLQPLSTDNGNVRTIISNELIAATSRAAPRSASDRSRFSPS